eukprot:2800942-Pyramimonas_sp.AAC.1
MERKGEVEFVSPPSGPPSWRGSTPRIPTEKSPELKSHGPPKRLCCSFPTARGRNTSARTSW